MYKIGTVVLLFLFAACSMAIPVTEKEVEAIIPAEIHKGERIIGGSLAKGGEYPFAVGIYMTRTNGRFFCGGTILTNLFIITAGHCVYQTQRFDIYMGVTNWNKEKPFIATTTTSIVHPLYNPNTLENDIGLIRLRIPLSNFNDYLRPIDFLPAFELDSYEQTVAIGWGLTSDTSGLSPDLKYVELETMTNAQCRATYGSVVKDYMVCVRGLNNEGACQGDSGSALVEPIGPHYVNFVGVMSFVSGRGCQTRDPSGYTRIHSYLDWIAMHTNRTE